VARRGGSVLDDQLGAFKQHAERAQRKPTKAGPALIAADAVRVTSRVAVDPDTAFRVFTEEVDAWWRTGPRFPLASRARWHAALRGRAGRSASSSTTRTAAASEVGRIRVWDPPRPPRVRLPRANFAPDESTEVEVRFEPSGEATDVTVVHSGFAALRAITRSATAWMPRVRQHDGRLLGRPAHRPRADTPPRAATRDEMTAQRRASISRRPISRSPTDRREADRSRARFLADDRQRDDLAARLVAIFAYDADWTSWEVHPDGDEIVVLLSGAVDLVLDAAGGQRTVELRDRGAAVVPRGIWHTPRTCSLRAKRSTSRAAPGPTHRPR
jgi:mannose-6-phosphate isomerase-like protein (cupin superfamily)